MRKKKISVPEGICKLTLTYGKFVESHILPRALTILSRKGEKTLQASLKTPTKKRFQGWYDNELCVTEGEYILSQIDNKAIIALRENLLIWSGWPSDMLDLNTPDIIISAKNNEKDYGLRVIQDLDWKPIKLFMLSLLWRSAASKREDMDTIELPNDLLEKLRICILSYDSLSPCEFPVRLYQIASKGLPHNRTPIIQEDIIDFGPPVGIKKYTACRIYLDGLIAYITLDPDDNYFKMAQPMIIGGDKQTIIFLHAYEKSRAFDNLLEVIEQA